MDRWVHDALFGSGLPGPAIQEHGAQPRVPPYSTSMDAARRIVKEMGLGVDGPDPLLICMKALRRLETEPEIEDCSNSLVSLLGRSEDRPGAPGDQTADGNARRGPSRPNGPGGRALPPKRSSRWMWCLLLLLVMVLPWCVGILWYLGLL